MPPGPRRPAVIVALLVAACSHKKGGDAAVPAFAAPTFTPWVQVVDEVGTPLAGARVSAGTTVVMTDDKGLAKLGAQPKDKTTAATITADGFAASTRRLSFHNAYAPLKVSLARYHTRTMDADIGGRIDLGTTAVHLPGRALMLDGKAYAGPVTARAVPLFDATLGPSGASSGDAFGNRGKGPVPIAFLGGVDLDLSTPDGKHLAFAAGERPLVSVLLPAGLPNKVGDKLPLWDLDRSSGLWNEVSSCRVEKADAPQGDRTLACVGTVEHFSAVAVGFPQSYVACLNVVLDIPQMPNAAYQLMNWSVFPREVPFYGGPGPFGYAPPFMFPYAAAPAWGYAGAPWGAFTMMLAAPWMPPDHITLDVMTYWVPQSWGAPFLPPPPYFPAGIQVPVTWTTQEWVDPWGIPTPERFDPLQPWACQQVTISFDALHIVVPEDPDADGDGFRRSVDCDDNDHLTYPGAPLLLCDGKDHNCDGIPDNQLMTVPGVDPYFDDMWNAGCAQTRLTCTGALHPELPGNRRDEDCDGIISDADGDGFFVQGDPFAPPGGPFDCDDNDPNVHPGALELPFNHRDENCDGVLTDQDGDGFISAKDAIVAGLPPGAGIDCNDMDPTVHPGAEVMDPPILRAYYEGTTRKAAFCDLFDPMGQPNELLRSMFLEADRNCNGVVDDMDGDGMFAATASLTPHPPPFDIDDYDPRVQVPGQPAGRNEKECMVAPLTPTMPGGPNLLTCPLLFDTPQYCVQSVTNGVAGQFVCVAANWNTYTNPPNPSSYGLPFGPCAPGVLPDCAAGTVCGGPITFAPWYQDALRRANPAYDVSQAFTGFCMPVCSATP